MIAASSRTYRARLQPMADHGLQVWNLLADPIAALYPNGRGWLAARLDDVTRQDAKCVLLVSGGKVAGLTIETPKASGTLKLSTLYVAPWARGAGVGHALLTRRTVAWKRAGIEDVYVTGRTTVPGLAPTLSGVGFSNSATIVDRYGPGTVEAVWRWHPTR